MELTWYGNASVVLREGKWAIAFDPFCGIRFGELKHPPQRLPFQEELQGVKDVFVTHGHFDHIYYLPRLYAGTGARIFCTQTPAATLVHHGLPPEQLRSIAPGWTGQVGPFTVRTYPGRHCRFDAPLVVKTVCSRRFFRHPGHLLRLLWLHLTCRERGETLFFEVECQGVRLQLMGSMALDKTAAYPTGADVLVLPLQGRSDQDRYALELVRRLAPKAVVLDHWDNSFEPMTGEVDVSGFIQNVKGSLHIPCITVVPGEPVTVENIEEMSL